MIITRYAVLSSHCNYRPTGVENLAGAGAGAGVAKIGMPGPGPGPGVFKFLINISI